MIENSVIVILKGRFGNILFQIAAGMSYSVKYNKNLYLFPGNGGGWINYYPLYNDFLKNFKIINQEDFDKINGVFWNETEPTHEYIEFPDVNKQNLIIDGYWQDLRYIDFNVISPKFMCPSDKIESIKERLNVKNYDDYVFMSIRHGLDYQRYNVALSMEWFENVYNKHFENKKAIIATDDILFVEKNLNIPDKRIIPMCDDFYLSHENLYLGTFFKNQIISNSSYSIWGALFQNNSDQKIVYPSDWFGVGSKIISVPTKDNWICEGAIFENHKQ